MNRGQLDGGDVGIILGVAGLVAGTLVLTVAVASVDSGEFERAEANTTGPPGTTGLVGIPPVVVAVAGLLVVFVGASFANRRPNNETEDNEE